MLILGMVLAALVVASGVALAVDMVGTNGEDTIYGTPDDDSILGYGGFDQLYGYKGSDYIDGGDGGGFIEGDDGREAETFNDVLVGGSDEDDMAGYNGNDKYYGLNGNDTIDAGENINSTYQQARRFRDVVNCGVGTDDTVVNYTPGRDKLIGCENKEPY
jgi:Ca2+-binding RTX toxin-like protein